MTKEVRETKDDEYVYKLREVVRRLVDFRSPFIPGPDDPLTQAGTPFNLAQVNSGLDDAGISDADAEAAALASEAIQAHLDGEPRKVIVRAPKLVNVVA